MLQDSVPVTGWKKLPQQVKVIGPGALQRREAATQDWGHWECLVRLPGVGASCGLTCRSCAVAKAISDHEEELWEEMSRLNSMKKEEVRTGSSQ